MVSYPHNLILEVGSMPVYMCRWKSGNVSFASAPSKKHAIDLLQEVDDATDLILTSVRDFMVHFRLDDNGELVLESFGEGTLGAIEEKAYPTLTGVKYGLLKEGEEFTDEGKILIAESVREERNRLNEHRPSRGRNRPGA